MNEENKPINLMIDAVFCNYNDDVELIARWLFKNNYISKNKKGNYVPKKEYKPIFELDTEIKEYDYCFKQMQEQIKKHKAKEDKLRELVKENETTYYTEDEAVDDCIVNGEDILQILNEGSNKE